MTEQRTDYAGNVWTKDGAGWTAGKGRGGRKVNQAKLDAWGQRVLQQAIEALEADPPEEDE